jgi:hypothetical protein
MLVRGLGILGERVGCVGVIMNRRCVMWSGPHLSKNRRASRSHGLVRDIAGAREMRATRGR